MVGSISVVGSSIVESHSSPPCLCLDALPSSNLRKHRLHRPWSVELSSSFVNSRHGWRLQMSSGMRRRKRNRDCFLKIVGELGGQYEDTFEDVKTQLLNYFTYKAVRTVLTQLYEMNPTQYRWFYSFVEANKPGDGKRFIRQLVKEKQELAERVMITRLHLYGKWVKKCDHAQLYQSISDENLELMRERLLQTVIWPSDDTNTEKIG